MAGVIPGHFVFDDPLGRLAEGTPCSQRLNGRVLDASGWYRLVNLADNASALGPIREGGGAFLSVT
jgi:hypothetical protein